MVNSTSKCTLKKTENTKMYTYMWHSSIFLNSKKKKEQLKHPLTSEWINKMRYIQVVLKAEYPHTGILLSHKRNDVLKHVKWVKHEKLC